MTNPTTPQTPPYSAVMVKILTKVYGEGAYLEWTQAPIKSRRPYPGDVEKIEFDNTDRVISCVDPRTDTDAALELLGYLCNNYGDLTNQQYQGWLFESWDLLYPGRGKNPRPSRLVVVLPISGPAFCTAVCNLAERVIGGA